MPRGSAKKILSKLRPVDQYDRIMEAHISGFTYCLRTGNARDKNGRFVKLKHSAKIITTKFPDKSTRVKSLFSIVRRDQVLNKIAELFCIKEERRLRYEKRMASIARLKKEYRRLSRKFLSRTV